MEMIVAQIIVGEKITRQPAALANLNMTVVVAGLHSLELEMCSWAIIYNYHTLAVADV